MKILNKLLPLLTALVMSAVLGGCGNRAEAKISQPTETAAVTPSVDEEKPFELSNSIIIDGHEYSLPTDPESFEKNFIVDNEAKSISNIAYKKASNKIGALLLDDQKVVSIDIDFSEATEMPPIIISDLEFSRELKYSDFIKYIDGREYKTMDLNDFTAVQLETGEVNLYLSFDNDGLSFASFFIHSEESDK